ncbi:hypothetical protein [Crossiella sp. CA198]|uniref:hypothetical protein n=1 Tax=Crossiella sp. CA198 TaxID=3455607 RepID=UPI003F8D78B3
MGTMRPTDPLTGRQLEVLRWISDGCPDGVMTGHAYKTSARALQARRMVKISKSKGAWSATLTEIGSYYLEHGRLPPKGAVSTASPPRSRTSPDKRNLGDTRAGQAAAERAPKPARTVKRSPTEQLVADVVAAGGLLKVAEGSDYDNGYRLSELVRNANRYGKVPSGKRLTHTLVSESGSWLGPRNHVVVLEDGPAGTDAPLQPVPVLDDVGRYHPVVSALRKSDQLRMASATRGRALRILHAVAVEAALRGFDVKGHKPKSGTEHRGRPTIWHLLLTVDADTVPLRISEESDRVEHVPTSRELADQKRHYWKRIPSHDEVASSRLRIDIGGPAGTVRKSFWADRASWSLEDKLPELLREVAVRADELRLRREAKVRAEASYAQAVERERQQALIRAAEAYRKKFLDDQMEHWREVRALREYAAAVAVRITAAEAEGQADNAAIADARRWLTWINNRADRRDPVRVLPVWPEPPKLQSYELRQFMNRVQEPVAMHYQPEKY